MTKKRPKMDATTSQPGARAQDRRGSVWSACDKLAEDGVKPTLSKIRPFHRGGSDTDVQADIQAWFAELFKRHCAQAEGMGMPPEIAALMRGLWESAQGSADAQLQAERDELEQKREAWKLDAVRALKERDESIAIATELERDLAAERERSTGLARNVADLETRLTEAISEGRQERGRADRLAAEIAATEIRHSEAMWQLREETGGQFYELRQAHAQELSIERAARSEEVVALREQLRQRGEHFDSELKQSEERLRAIEKRLLLEQDAVRHSVAEWKRKAQEEREAGDAKVSVVRRQMEDALVQLGGLRSQLAANEIALAESRRAAAKAQEDLAQIAKSMATKSVELSPAAPQADSESN